MHGRPREFKHKLKDPKAAEAYAKKVEAIKSGTTAVLSCRAAARYDAPALKAAEKLLKVVPEIYTLWNYRREALEPLIRSQPSSSSSSNAEDREAAIATELALTAAALMENPKSYATWHHRRWLVEAGGCDLHQELGLVTRALELDGRNFHAWRHRQWVVGRLGVPPEEELDYSGQLIASDFSNYSAWHYRSVLLPRVYGGGAGGVATVTFEELMKQPAAAAAAAAGGSTSSSSSAPAARPQGFSGTAVQAGVLPAHMLDQEYELVHQAFATDAADQSPWLYYRWLLGNTLGAARAAAAAAAAAGGGGDEQELAAVRQQVLQVLSREVGRFESDHLEQDPGAKWPLLMVAQLKQAQADLTEEPGQQQRLKQQVAELYTRLMEVDPLRKGFYQDAAAGRAAVVVRGVGQQDVLIAESAVA